MERLCKKHGLVEHAWRTDNRWRCKRCSVEEVTRRRRKVKIDLVRERGGRCEQCGYDRYVGALDFHHRDSSTKEFNLSNKGATISLARLRAEADKCDLLCANCHREVEGNYDPQ